MGLGAICRRTFARCGLIANCRAFCACGARWTGPVQWRFAPVRAFDSVLGGAAALSTARAQVSPRTRHASRRSQPRLCFRRPALNVECQTNRVENGPTPRWLRNDDRGEPHPPDAYAINIALWFSGNE